MSDLKIQIKNSITLIALTIVFVVLFISCKKNELGGKSSIEGNVSHHSKSIADAVIYIKMGTTESPGDDISKYDFEISTDANGNFKSPGIYKGDYYLYAVGKDFSVPPPWIVKGGIPVKVRYNENVKVSLPVSE